MSRSRTLWAAVCLAAGLGVASHGCALIPPLLYWHSRTLNASPTSAEAITTSGTAWFGGTPASSSGSGDGASVAASVALPTSPLVNSNPLTAVEPLSNVIPLTAVEPLANVTPLTNADPLTVVEPYRVLSRRTQAETPVLYVEAVDPATGALLKRRLGSSDGKFEIAYVPPARARSVILQATVVYSGKVTGYLCLPLAIGTTRGGGKADITFGSTALALSDALLAGVRDEFDVATGFRKFKSAQLADTAGLRDASVTARAAAALDASTALASVADVGQALADVTSAARTLAARAGDLIAQEGRTLDAFTAAAEAIMAKVADTKIGALLSSAISDAAAQVDLTAFKARVGEVRVRREESEARLAAPATTPAPAPVTTTTPGDTTTGGSTTSPGSGNPASPAPRLTGTVIDAETRLPLAGKIVTAGGLLAKTDANGFFALETTQTGTMSLAIETSPTSTFSTTVDIPAGTGRDLGTLAVMRTHWFPVASPVSATLRHVSVISDTMAYAGGPGATLIRTLDGSTWATTSAGLEGDVEDMIIGAPAGLVVTAVGMFGTQDKGATWIKVTADMAGTALAIDHDAQTAFVNRLASEGNGVKKSAVTGLGVTTPAGTDLDTPLLNLTLVPGTSRALFGTSTQSVYVSRDDGGTWSKLAPVPLDFPAEGRHPVLADSSGRILAAGASDSVSGDGILGVIAFSSDSGATWRTQNTLSNSFKDAKLLAVRPRFQGGFTAVGACGTIYSMVADGVFAAGQVSGKVGCGETLFDVGFAPDLSVGWAVGEDGTILKYKRDID